MDSVKMHHTPIDLSPVKVCVQVLIRYVLLRGISSSYKCNSLSHKHPNQVQVEQPFHQHVHQHHQQQCAIQTHHHHRFMLAHRSIISRMNLDAAMDYCRSTTIITIIMPAEPAVCRRSNTISV